MCTMPELRIRNSIDQPRVPRAMSNFAVSLRQGKGNWFLGRVAVAALMLTACCCVQALPQMRITSLHKHESLGSHKKIRAQLWLPRAWRAGHAEEGAVLHLRGGAENLEKKLPDSVESFVKGFERWWLVAVIWLINVELLWRGSFLNAVRALWWFIGKFVRIGRFAGLVIVVLWALEKVFTTMTTKMKPPMHTTVLNYPPAAVVYLSGGKFVVGGGAGEDGPGVANRASLLVDDGTQLVSAAECDFGAHKVQALAYHEDVGIVCYAGCEVHRMRASGRGRKYALARGRPLALPDVLLKQRAPVNASSSRTLCFSPSGSMLATSAGSTIDLWHSPKFEADESHTPATAGGEIEQNGSASMQQSVHSSQADVSHNQTQAHFRHVGTLQGREEIVDMRFNPRGNMLIAVDEGKITVWDVSARARSRAKDTRSDSHARVCSITCAEAMRSKGAALADSCTFVGGAFADAGHTVYSAVSCPEGSFLVRYSLIAKMAPQRIIPLGKEVVTAFDCAGESIALGTKSGHVFVVSKDRMRVMRVVKVHKMPVSRVEVLPKGDVMSVGFDNVCSRLMFSQSVTLAAPWAKQGQVVSKKAKDVVAAGLALVDMFLELAGRKAPGIARSVTHGAIELTERVKNTPVKSLLPKGNTTIPSVSFSKLKDGLTSMGPIASLLGKNDQGSEANEDQSKEPSHEASADEGQSKAGALGEANAGATQARLGPPTEVAKRIAKSIHKTQWFVKRSEAWSGVRDEETGKTSGSKDADSQSHDEEKEEEGGIVGTAAIIRAHSRKTMDSIKSAFNFSSMFKSVQGLVSRNNEKGVEDRGGQKEEEEEEGSDEKDEEKEEGKPPSYEGRNATGLASGQGKSDRIVAERQTPTGKGSEGEGNKQVKEEAAENAEMKKVAGGKAEGEAVKRAADVGKAAETSKTTEASKTTDASKTTEASKTTQANKAAEANKATATNRTVETNKAVDHAHSSTPTGDPHTINVTHTSPLPSHPRSRGAAVSTDAADVSGAKVAGLQNLKAKTSNQDMEKLSTSAVTESAEVKTPVVGIFKSASPVKGKDGDRVNSEPKARNESEQRKEEEGSVKSHGKQPLEKQAAIGAVPQRQSFGEDVAGVADDAGKMADEMDGATNLDKNRPSVQGIAMEVQEEAEKKKESAVEVGSKEGGPSKEKEKETPVKEKQASKAANNKPASDVIKSELDLRPVKSVSIFDVSSSDEDTHVPLTFTVPSSPTARTPRKGKTDIFRKPSGDLKTATNTSVQGYTSSSSSPMPVKQAGAGPDVTSSMNVSSSKAQDVASADGAKGGTTPRPSNIKPPGKVVNKPPPPVERQDAMSKMPVKQDGVAGKAGKASSKDQSAGKGNAPGKPAPRGK